MNDNLFSLSCSKCENSLVSATVCNPMFIVHHAECPFCGDKTSLAKLPTLCLILGSILTFLSFYSMLYKVEVISLTTQICGLGIGIGCLIFGLIFLRFVSVKKKFTYPKKHSNTTTHRRKAA